MGTINSISNFYKGRFLSNFNYLAIMCSFAAIFISILTGKGHYVFMLLGLSQLPQILQNYFVKLKHRWNCCILLPLTLPKILYEVLEIFI